MATTFMPAAKGSARTPLGPIRLCLEPRAGHALRSDQYLYACSQGQRTHSAQTKNGYLVLRKRECIT